MPKPGEKRMGRQHRVNDFRGGDPLDHHDHRNDGDEDAGYHMRRRMRGFFTS